MQNKLANNCNRNVEDNKFPLKTIYDCACIWTSPSTNVPSELSLFHNVGICPEVSKYTVCTGKNMPPTPYQTLSP